MYRLDVHGLSYSVGATRILHGVRLSLRSGELIALLGPSGSGKSTLLTSMIGFRPGEGKVRLCGLDLYERFEELKRLIGFVPQDDIIHLGLSVEKTLRYAAMLRLPPDMPEAYREATVRSVLEQVDLTERRHVRVRQLSGGQRKRVSIAVELLAKPPLLFLDEPTSGLDPALEEKTMELFRSLTTPDRLTVVTTHVLASLDLVDHAIVMAAGRLVFFGPPAEATTFFGVPDLPSIYRTLAKTSPVEWEQKYRATSLYRDLIEARLAEPSPPLPLTSAKSAHDDPPLALETAAAARPAAPGAAPAAPSPSPADSLEEQLQRLKEARRKS